MNVLVMAAGSVGGYFGGMLARADNDVLFVARGENLAAITGRGLVVESATSGDFTVEASAIERPDGSWTADLVLFCVKSYHNSVAIDTIMPAVGPETTVLTLQNGIGSGDELSALSGHSVSCWARHTSRPPTLGRACSRSLAGNAVSSSPSRTAALPSAARRSSGPSQRQGSTPRSPKT